jgi:hypothetical protein
MTGPLATPRLAAQRQAQTWWWLGLLLGLLLAASLLAAGAWHWRQRAHAQDSLARHLNSLQSPQAGTEVPCASLPAGRPLVLLVLGQSNAGNHGEIAGTAGPVTTVTAHASGQATCHRSWDPLPGGTGGGHSVWARLPSALVQAGLTRPLVLGVLGVDASSIEDWTDASGPLPPRLRALAVQMRAEGLAPQWVLWQHGESNARAGTRSEVYAQRLGMLAAQLTDAGVDAPILLAQSTLCRSAPSVAIRAAMQQVVQASTAPASTSASGRVAVPPRLPRFVLGPDTDALSDAQYRRDACHFSTAGLSAAAKQWAQVLALLSGPSR